MANISQLLTTLKSGIIIQVVISNISVRSDMNIQDINRFTEQVVMVGKLNNMDLSGPSK
jgi:hypothetical protein